MTAAARHIGGGTRGRMLFAGVLPKTLECAEFAETGSETGEFSPAEGEDAFPAAAAHILPEGDGRGGSGDGSETATQAGPEDPAGKPHGANESHAPHATPPDRNSRYEPVEAGSFVHDG
ncbi:MAG: hypothetical protein ACLFWF_05070 [Alphaproteobacteria bacterium]